MASVRSSKCPAIVLCFSCSLVNPSPPSSSFQHNVVVKPPLLSQPLNTSWSPCPSLPVIRSCCLLFSKEDRNHGRQLIHPLVSSLVVLLCSDKKAALPGMISILFLPSKDPGWTCYQSSSVSFLLIEGIDEPWNQGWMGTPWIQVWQKDSSVSGTWCFSPWATMSLSPVPASQKGSGGETEAMRFTSSLHTVVSSRL